MRSRSARGSRTDRDPPAVSYSGLGGQRNDGEARDDARPGQLTTVRFRLHHRPELADGDGPGSGPLAARDREPDREARGPGSLLSPWRVDDRLRQSRAVRGARPGVRRRDEAREPHGARDDQYRARDRRAPADQTTTN